MTIPTYQQGTQGLLTGSHKQVFQAYVVPSGGSAIALDVQGGRIGWDESRAPRVSASLRCSVPSVDILTQIDPRTGCRLTCYAGYVTASGSQDVAQIADLVLRRRTVNRPSDELILDAASDESLVIDASPVFGSSVSAASVPVAMQTLLNAALNPDPSVTISIVDATSVSLTDITDLWNAINDLADQINADVYDDGMRHWYIEPRPTIASMSSMSLRVGPGGILVDTSSVVDRDNWGNVVKVRYQWTDASNVAHTIVGSATTTLTSYLPASAGTKTYVVERETPTTQTQANLAAAAILARMQARSRAYTLKAPAAWWLRPGQTVTVTLPTDAEERHLVSSVDFSIDDYSMSVTTRLPDLATAQGE